MISEKSVSISKRQEDIENQLFQMKRIMYDIEASHYFEQNDNVETFNKLIGDSQLFVFDGMIKNNKNKFVKNVENLLIFIMNEKTKTESKKEIENFVFINSNKMNESLMNLETIDSIGISSYTTEMLYENGTLNSNDFINLVNCFDCFLIEIQYNGNDQSSHFKTIYDIVIQLKQNCCIKLKIQIKINGINQTNQKFQNNQDIFSVIIDPSVLIIAGGNQKGSFENCKSLEKVFIPNSRFSNFN